MMIGSITSEELRFEEREMVEIEDTIVKMIEGDTTITIAIMIERMTETKPPQERET